MEGLGRNRFERTYDGWRQQDIPGSSGKNSPHVIQPLQGLAVSFSSPELEEVTPAEMHGDEQLLENYEKDNYGEVEVELKSNPRQPVQNWHGFYSTPDPSDQVLNQLPQIGADPSDASTDKQFLSTLYDPTKTKKKKTKKKTMKKNLSIDDNFSYQLQSVASFEGKRFLKKAADSQEIIIPASLAIYLPQTAQAKSTPLSKLFPIKRTRSLLNSRGASGSLPRKRRFYSISN